MNIVRGRGVVKGAVEPGWLPAEFLDHLATFVCDIAGDMGNRKSRMVSARCGWDSWDCAGAGGASGLSALLGGGAAQRQVSLHAFGVGGFGVLSEVDPGGLVLRADPEPHDPIDQLCQRE